MKIVKDTLSVMEETWDDPGDYPNAVASGPLASYNYVAGVEGTLVCELTDEELEWCGEDPKEFIDNDDSIGRAVPSGISVVKWGHVLKGNLLELEVLECDSSNYKTDYDGPDCEDY